MAHEDFMTKEWITDEMELEYDILTTRILIHAENLIGKLNFSDPPCWKVNWYDILEVRNSLHMYGAHIHDTIEFLNMGPGKGKEHLKTLREKERRLQRDQDATIEAMLTWEKQNNQVL